MNIGYGPTKDRVSKDQNDFKAPPGALRAKSLAFSSFLLSLFIISFSKKIPLNYIYLTIFCAGAIIVGILVCRDMWKLKSSQRPRWLSFTFGLTSVLVLVALNVLNDMKLLVWNQIYLWVPVAIISALEAIGAWLTESRKSVHVFYDVKGFVYVPITKAEVKIVPNAEFLKETRNKLIRLLVSLTGLVFFCILLIVFIAASFWMDKLFGFIEILPTWSSWRDNAFTFFLVVGFSLAMWAIAQFVNVNGLPVTVIFPPSKLVTTGLYSQMRNPMLFGVFIALLGIGFVFNSVSFILLFIPLFVLLNIIELKKVEEPQLEKHFGNEYIQYKQTVPMFIPWLKIRKRAKIK